MFWDERYLTSTAGSSIRLGKYLDGREGLEFVDIGGIGEWGEMHSGAPYRRPLDIATVGGNWLHSRQVCRGLSPGHRRPRQSVPQHASVPQRRSISRDQRLRRLARCHFRQDGLTPLGPSANVGELYFRPYSLRGVVCNYEFHGSYRSMVEKGWDLRQTLEAGLRDPISYLNTNVFNPQSWEDAPAEVKQLFVEASQRIGYRFVLAKLLAPAELRLDGKTPARLLVEHTWTNTGVAPCYESYALRFTLHDAGGRVVAEQIHFPQRPTTRWLPRRGRRANHDPRSGQDRPWGLRVEGRHVPPRRPGQHVLLGIQGRDDEDRYALCDSRPSRPARSRARSMKKVLRPRITAGASPKESKQRSTLTPVTAADQACCWRACNRELGTTPPINSRRL